VEIRWQSNGLLSLRGFVSRVRPLDWLSLVRYYQRGWLSDVAAATTGSIRQPGREAVAKHSVLTILVCTTGMVADQVRNIGGKHVEITTLMGAGVDPHLYQASPADITALQRAGIIFYSGLHLEGKLTQLLEQMREQKPAVAVAEVIAEGNIRRDEHGAADPHIWFDVGLWSAASGAVEDALSKFDPPNAADYHAGAEEYQLKLAELDAEVAGELKTIPAESRVLVTAHDAFHYFGDAYGVEVRAIQGISTDSEAGVKQVKELVDFLVERKVKAVFVETSVAEENIKSLVEGCQARGHDVKIGGTLFSDAMGEAGTPEGTYEGMVRANVKTIVNALQ
jgi:manganese/zinc/iron transport system substrate-binding protein